MQLAAGTVALTVASGATGELTGGWSPAEVTARGLGSLAFLVVCGTVLGFGAYTWLMRVVPPATVSTYAFVNPVIALALGWAVGDDQITWRTAVAAVLVVGSILLTRQRGRNSADWAKTAPPARPSYSGPSPVLIADTR
jgi:drug/metabolite transporter (DMT)-like permease